VTAVAGHAIFWPTGQKFTVLSHRVYRNWRAGLWL